MLTQLVGRVGLDDVFTVEAGADVNVPSTQFDRYVDAWTGITGMLSDNGLKLVLRHADGVTYLSARAVAEWNADSDVIDFTATRKWRRTNHLIGLGSGEGKDRLVSHWYADSAGNVSQKQSLFGLDEIQAIYDYSNADADELAKETEKKLTDLQEEGGVDVTVHDGLDLDVGDIVNGCDNVTGITVRAMVRKKIVKASRGMLTVSYEAGTTTGGVPSGSTAKTSL